MSVVIKLMCNVLFVAALGQTASYGNLGVGKRGQELIGPIDDYECPKNGVFHDPDDCVQFIECYQDQANLWRCTDQQLFDLTYNGCNFANYVHCEERPRPSDYPDTDATTPPTTTLNYTPSTTPPPPIDFECLNDGVFANEEKCEYYWECWAGVAELIHCQLDYLFDRRYDGCNFPNLTDCDHRTRPGDPTTLLPSTLLTTTGDPVTSVTSSGDPETESTVATTSEGSNETTAAPSVTTPESSVTTTLPTTSTSPGEEFECPAIDKDYADPQCCSKYYTCVGGIAYHQSCPEGLYFDEEEDQCGYPSDVSCDSRPTTCTSAKSLK